MPKVKKKVVMAPRPPRKGKVVKKKEEKVAMAPRPPRKGKIKEKKKVTKKV